jgi:hypothetical protein
MGRNTCSPRTMASFPYTATAGKYQKLSLISLYNQLTVGPHLDSHRFWSHPSATESLIFHGWADPCKDQDHILDANMLRNVVGYFADCHEAGLAPSAFQLILFYDNASSLLTPPGLNWMPLWLLIIVHYVLANWIAAGLLGYV